MNPPRLRGAFAPGAAPAAHQDLLVLLPSLGTTSELWDGVVARLRADPVTATLRVLRVDLPGHGASPPAHDPFTVADLAEAVLAVVDEAGGGAFHAAGVSLGGAVALELAATHPARVRTLTMCGSGARIGTPEGWAERAAGVRSSGTASLVAASATRWFAPGFPARDQRAAARALDALTGVDDESYARCAEALARFDRSAGSATIAVPTLLISGGHDAVTPPASMDELAEALPRAVHVTIASAGHLAPLEAPADVAALVRDHLAASSDADARDARARGMRVRRAVLGDAHVDAAVAATTPLTAAFQDLLTRYAWGEVWDRPVLSRRERSIATLAGLVTGGHVEELRMHVHAAVRNGLRPDEVAEVVLHTALYAGLPSANTAMAVVREALAPTDPTRTGTGTGTDTDEQGGGHGQERRDG
jgi:3-oxoadipate enol-lactonase/4-carboxymuconolactone decarboxylase